MSTNHISLFESHHNEAYNMLHGMWLMDLRLTELQCLIATINTLNKSELKLKYSAMLSDWFSI
jgi:hypothetical protein